MVIFMRYKRRREFNKINFSENDLVNRILNKRDIKNISETDYSISNLLPYEDMADIKKAASIIADNVISKGKIVIVGDYDCDGATSTAISKKGLLLLGAKDENVTFMVPDRFKLGYGLTPKIVDLIKVGDPNLIITVDNGISSIDGAEAVKKLKNCKLIITDHHLSPNEIPDADAVVDPNRKDCKFKSKNLAGCGVIFYVLLAVRDELYERGYYKKTGKKPPLGELLDLVALGTVADVVKLDYNNRILVHNGLERIRRGYVSPGLAELLISSNVDIEKVKSSDFGFKVGPKINAAGRLKDMSIGIRCLLTDDYGEARKLSNILSDLNMVRKRMQSNMSYDAISNLGKIESMKRKGVCIYNKDYHEGIVGLIAGRIKEDYHRPAVVFADVQDQPELIKGSGRSVPSVRLRDIFEEIDRKHGIILKFGGHDMAAGLTIKKSDFDSFSDVFNDEVSKILKRIDVVVEHDGPLMMNEFNLLTATHLETMGPWGQGFPEPVFSNTFIIRGVRSVGERENHLKLDVSLVDPKTKEIGNGVFTAMSFAHFDNPDNKKFKVGQMFQSVYSTSVNEYNDKKSLQIIVRDMVDYDEYVAKNEKNINKEDISLGL